jgi:release factor glutamine methyltransferase
MTVREALRVAELRLAAAGVPEPRVDAELLLAHLLGVRRSAVYADLEREVDGIEPLLSRRETREPLAYVLGEWGFRGLVLEVDARALVPRPETETLVERALALIRDVPAPRVLDIGVGSGAIALAIADEHSGARVTGVDISQEALALARENADALGLRVDLREGGVETAAEGWDLVISNPPYVGRAEELEPELGYEPAMALFDTGMHAEIAAASNTTWLALEVADDRAAAVADDLAAAGYLDVRITQDLAGRDRVVEGRRA